MLLVLTYWPGFVLIGKYVVLIVPDGCAVGEFLRLGCHSMVAHSCQREYSWEIE